MIHPNTIKDFLQLWWSIKLSEWYHPDTIKDFAIIANQTWGKLTINIGTIHPDTIKEIIKLGGWNITIEL